jgi:hypothetical protein
MGADVAILGLLQHGRRPSCDAATVSSARIISPALDAGAATVSAASDPP